MDVYLIDFEPKGDIRGKLVALEIGRDIPFTVKRIFYIYDTKENVARAKHANVRTRQVIICQSGRCTVMVDDGRERREIILDRPERGLFIGPMIWRAIYNMSKDCVILVITDDLYDPEEYIRDYGEFKRMAMKAER